MKSVFRSEAGGRAIREATRALVDVADVRSQIIETPLGPTHLLEAGDPDAPPLMLLHGTASNAASWLGEISGWARRFRVIAPDMPGEPGLSVDRRLSLAKGEHAAWLIALLEALSIDAARIVGMSLGGWAALDFARRHPARVEALALIASSGLAPQRLSFVLKAAPLLLLGGWGLDRVNDIVCAGAALPEEARAFGALVARHFRPVTERVPVFTDAHLEALSMPLLYIGGDRDALLDTPASAARLRARLPHAEVHALEGVGHVVLGQGARVSRFLERLSDQTP